METALDSLRNVRIPLPKIERGLAILGIAAAVPLAFRVLQTCYVYLRPSSLPKYWRPNAWALVTGASDGIGRGFALELASKGFNIVLHGRNPTKLEVVKQSILAQSPNTKIRIILIDAGTSHGMKKAIDEAVGSLADLDGPLTVLINNVGGSSGRSPIFVPLSEDVPEGIDDSINLNSRFPVLFTRALLPMLTKAAPGVIINIGSVAGIFGMPLLSVYSATKAFDLAWSASLAREMMAEGLSIEVLGIAVGKTTDTSHFKQASKFFEPTSRTLASASLARVGCGRLILAAYWPHALLIWFMRLMPESVQSNLFIKMMKEEQAYARQRYGELDKQK